MLEEDQDSLSNTLRHLHKQNKLNKVGEHFYRVFNDERTLKDIIYTDLVCLIITLIIAFALI